jgi:8-oxo-dGTP pyrophosphatase MutT (NUDIX family)
MRWQVRSERTVFRDQWLDLCEADVEVPGGRHLNHKVIHVAPGAGTVVVNDADEVLLLWRHRFITDSWGYEIPIGKIEAGEEAMAAAHRECVEETGWEPGPLRPLLTVHPSNGLLDSAHHVYYAAGARHLGDPVDDFESERIDWVPLASVFALIAEHKIMSATTVASLLYAAQERSSR